MGRATSAAPDAVDAIIEQWRTQRPDLDPSAKEITGRIVRLASLFHQAYADAFRPLGLNDGDYGMLAALRRSNPDGGVTPTELARQQMMTSGGMTAALDRLERKTLIARRPNPADRRGSLVQLTDTGRRLVDEAMQRHVDVEHHLIASLNVDQRTQLRELLHSLLAVVDTVK